MRLISFLPTSEFTVQLQWIIPKLLTVSASRPQTSLHKAFSGFLTTFLTICKTYKKGQGTRYWATHKQSEIRMGDEDFNFSAPHSTSTQFPEASLPQEWATVASSSNPLVMNTLHWFFTLPCFLFPFHYFFYLESLSIAVEKQLSCGTWQSCRYPYGKGLNTNTPISSRELCMPLALACVCLGGLIKGLVWSYLGLISLLTMVRMISHHFPHSHEARDLLLCSVPIRMQLQDINP